MNTEQKRKILVVDDDSRITTILKKVLTINGYAVDAFTDSMAALYRVNEHPDAYEAIITDQTMPALMGTELAQAVLEKRPERLVILCTGYSDVVDEGQAAGMGIDYFMMKPISYELLLSILKERLI